MKSIGNILNSRKPRHPKPDSFEGLPIRPSVKRTRFYIDNEYFERGYAAVFPNSVTIVYCILARHAKHETQICYPSAPRIMEYGGIKNRRTIFDAIRILEAFNIIAVVHSKGYVSNDYALLDPSVWQAPDSGKVDTVRETRRSKPTVAVNPPQPSQNQPLNSGTDDTRSHITKSNNEIKDELKKFSIKGTELLQRLSVASKSLLTSYFREDDVISALEELNASGFEVENLGYKPVIEALRRRGATPIKELPAWIKI